MLSYSQRRLQHPTSKAHCWIISLLLFAIPVLAETPAPSQDFWEYMTDFDDENGSVVDPLEYDQLSNLKNSAATDLIENTSSDESEQKNHSNIRNTDMKLKVQSSIQSSSLAMKGGIL
ncbi:MAG: hypothetical protein V4732_08470 [Pseudomonadota bacterium]